jgi:predicted double-glycine peptidase
MAQAQATNLVREQHDLSCAAAALATLLTFHYQNAVSAEQVFISMYENGDRDRIGRDGFSMLDMKRFLSSFGFTANGYRASLDRLRDLGIPAVALVDLRGYSHFVVITGIDDDKVTIADPAMGAKSYQRAAFEDMWNGVLFLVTSHLDVGRRHFDTGRDEAGDVVAGGAGS